MRPAPSETAALFATIEKAKGLAPSSGRPEGVLRDHIQPALEELLAKRGVRSAAHNELRLAVPAGPEAALLDAPLTSVGRADAVYNRFVIEFEPPGSLRASVMHSATRHAVNQVQQYLRGVSTNAGIALDRLAGCAFDGDWITYVTWDRGSWQVSVPKRVDADSLLVLVDTLASLATGRGLTSINLAEDFGRSSSTAKQVIPALSNLLLKGRISPRGLAMFDQWTLDVSNAAGAFSTSDVDEWQSLCLELSLPTAEASSKYILFGLQTYFALIAKLIGLVILEGAMRKSLVKPLLVSDPIGTAFRDLENGEITLQTGAANAIEPGIFSWYAWEKSTDLSEALRALTTSISEYSAEMVEITPLVARDVLKDLYQRLLPGSIRHRLGEYYTPDWLAQRVINQVTGSDIEVPLGKRVLDPACGSGTFLLEVISRMIRSSSSIDPVVVLRSVVQNVVGFDLSPLAVQASKVNYLLAIAPLLRFATEPIFIPVYLADSISPPRRGGLLEGNVFILETSQGDWRIPVAVAETNQLPALGEILMEAIAERQDETWLADQVLVRIVTAKTDRDSVVAAAKELLRKLQDLDYTQRDGMWWSLVTSAFAPSLHGRFDFVIGNPPWVSWETLPERYRRANDAQWLLYRLRPDVPGGRRQPSAHVLLDLSMLFVGRCIDKYLSPRGKLGFVITASIFQSELAGRGFRRRHVPPNSSYRFLHIDEMASLQIFEGATNRTSVLIADRAQLGRSDPIPVTRWAAPAGGRSIPASLDLTEVASRTTRRNLVAEPADPSDSLSPLLIMPPGALSASRPVRRPSPYLNTVRNGIHTRGANGIFFVEVIAAEGDLLRVRNLPAQGANRTVSQVEGLVERQIVKKLIRGADVSAGSAIPRIGVLLFHGGAHVSSPFGPAEVRRRFPRAFEFIQNFEDILRNRTPFRNFNPRGDDWLGIYSVTRAALAGHKVVIREIAQGMIAAPVHSADAIPDHKLYVIPTSTREEADYLSSCLNSRVVDFLIRSFAISTSITGSFLRYVGVRDLAALPLARTADASMAQALNVSIHDYRVLDQIAAKELG